MLKIRDMLVDGPRKDRKTRIIGPWTVHSDISLNKSGGYYFLMVFLLFLYMTRPLSLCLAWPSHKEMKKHIRNVAA